MGFQVAYVPIGVGTFHLESAQDQFEKSVSMLRGLTADCAVPEKMLLTINDLDAYLDTISPDLIVLQNITFANARRGPEVVKFMPMDRLMLETDAPYMAPEPFRGKRCDSTMIRLTAERVAEWKGLSAEEVLDITLENGERFFGID